MICWGAAEGGPLIPGEPTGEVPAMGAGESPGGGGLMPPRPAIDGGCIVGGPNPLEGPGPGLCIAWLGPPLPRPA